ncbi:sigma-70 family RNA polymerase sigma factor [Stieleria sp. JC731]|uniref:sigma-70 family RNA polymerase sigma factor n=1 Tax=Stieleria sp. JC731 TaxID=2894195 RepID=UPI001E57690E|nr:sigma-70 family RNA polymerase sigma factor [Stieleria sp. JC731]MCC9600312.1 sigma-70 family RNA polymerase sigma factor [Stieleria sp. JC731]
MTIDRARRGSTADLGKLLQRYQNYLYLLAVTQIGTRISRRASASDVVQETMLAAHRDFSQFRGQSQSELAAWLRCILSRNLIREFERHLAAEKRDVRREISFEAIANGMESSCTIAAALIGSRQADPAQILIDHEESVRVADLVAMLPEDYRTIVMLKVFSGLKTNEIADEMSRSPQAIRLLWMRALRQLRSMHEEKIS